ncbi:MAG: hypothetical protein J6Y20_01355 [Lachnospiraceae bacterium]|nr:hypothetical protein [Lachnospiraceae bacterium]
MDEEARIKKLIEEAEALEWGCNLDKQTHNGKTEQYIEFEQYTPAGEDFIFTAWGETAEEIARDVFRYAEDFDQSEHVQLNLGARGAPDAYTLAIDSQEIKKMLDVLAERLAEAVKE